MHTPSSTSGAVFLGVGGAQCAWLLLKLHAAAFTHRFACGCISICLHFTTCAFCAVGYARLQPGHFGNFLSFLVHTQRRLCHFVCVFSIQRLQQKSHGFDVGTKYRYDIICVYLLFIAVCTNTMYHHVLSPILRLDKFLCHSSCGVDCYDSKLPRVNKHHSIRV